MEKPSPKSRDFKVVIVGGGVAGLTLAHCLERIGIDYVVLERRDNIAPQVGASIAILANGGRILDQLGMFNDVLELTEPLITNTIWSGSGKELNSSDRPKLVEKR
jgi:2-polyprenyl-6-methoxyphenol hydroxylase-like FAD-dependent oxidoreductase